MAGFDGTSALRGLCYALAGLYGCLVLWATYKLYLLWRAASGSGCCGGWSSQRTLHVMVVLVGLVRVSFFSVVPDWSSDFFYGRISGVRSESWQFVLDETPTLLLVALTSAHVLIWARAYHTFRHAPDTFARRVLPVVTWANAGLWGCQLGLWAAFEAYPPSADAISLVSALLHVLCFAVLAASVWGYASGLARQYMSVPMSLARRVRRVRELRAIAAVCAAAFLLRSGAIATISITTAARDDGFDGLVDRTSQWELLFTGCFFLLLEVVPVAMLLWHHRRVAVMARPMPGGATPTTLLKLRQKQEAMRVRKERAEQQAGTWWGGAGAPSSSAVRGGDGLGSALAAAESSPSSSSSSSSFATIGLGSAFASPLGRGASAAGGARTPLLLGSPSSSSTSTILASSGSFLAAVGGYGAVASGQQQQPSEGVALIRQHYFAVPASSAASSSRAPPWSPVGRAGAGEQRAKGRGLSRSADDLLSGVAPGGSSGPLSVHDRRSPAAASGWHSEGEGEEGEGEDEGEEDEDEGEEDEDEGAGTRGNNKRRRRRGRRSPFRVGVVRTIARMFSVYPDSPTSPEGAGVQGLRLPPPGHTEAGLDTRGSERARCDSGGSGRTSATYGSLRMLLVPGAGDSEGEGEGGAAGAATARSGTGPTGDGGPTADGGPSGRGVFTPGDREKSAELLSFASPPGAGMLPKTGPQPSSTASTIISTVDMEAAFGKPFASGPLQAGAFLQPRPPGLGGGHVS